VNRLRTRRPASISTRRFMERFLPCADGSS
jgi:hypothetical protein